MPGRQGIVFDIKEFAVFDGPGIRTTVFMKGCPLHCMWCHNPEGLRVEPELMVSRAACTHCGACDAVCPSPGNCILCGNCIPACPLGLRKVAGTPWEAEALAERLLKDQDVYLYSGGGVTFSGGEPLLQWPFVSAVIDRLRAEGVHTAIETSGFTSDEVFSEVMEKLSLVMMDWKVSDPEKHLYYTGASQAPILKHVQMLAEGETPFIIRMPVIPGVNDERAHFERVASLLQGAKALVRVDVLPYQRAAGAKYEMVGRKYQPEFNEEKPLEIFTEVFEEVGIPYQKFR